MAFLLDLWAHDKNINVFITYIRLTSLPFDQTHECPLYPTLPSITHHDSMFVESPPAVNGPNFLMTTILFLFLFLLFFFPKKNTSFRFLDGASNSRSAFKTIANRITLNLPRSFFSVTCSASVHSPPLTMKFHHELCPSA